jgi:cell division septal protein FtsQ
MQRQRDIKTRARRKSVYQGVWILTITHPLGRRKEVIPPKLASSGRGQLGKFLALLTLVAELLGSVFFFSSGVFAVSNIKVVGNTLIPTQYVIKLAGLNRKPNFLLLSTSNIQANISKIPWVKATYIKTGFPDSITIRIVEWRPKDIFVSGKERYVLASNGKVLGYAGKASGLPVIVGPTIKVQSGKILLPQSLITAINQIYLYSPKYIGQSISYFSMDCAADLQATVSQGWQIIFGEVLTSSQIDQLRIKMAALNAVLPHIGLPLNQIKYINLENPYMVAVMTKNATKPSPQVYPYPKTSFYCEVILYCGVNVPKPSAPVVPSANAPNGSCYV